MTSYVYRSMRDLLREPLLHFLIAGGFLFVAHAWVNQGKENETHIVRIGAGEVNWLKETWSRQRSRQPDEKELRGLVASYLKESLLVREARELGLEKGDTVVRRRLAQKMEFLVQDAASLVEPDEKELHGFYNSKRALYRSPARISFTQIYFKDKASALQGLDQLKVQDASTIGDTSLLARDYVRIDEQAVKNVFGPNFSTSAFALDPGQWQGPLTSGYGFHLVQIKERQEAKPLSFQEVRKRVLQEAHRIQQDKAKKQYLARLLEKYEIVMDDNVASLLGPITEALQ